MLYCTNCGKQNSSGAKYCRWCGASLAAVIDSHSAPTLPYRVDPYTAPSAPVYEQVKSTEPIDRRRLSRKAKRESKAGLGLFLSGIGPIAIIHSLSLGIPGFERLLIGPLGWLFLAVAAVGAFVKVVWDRRIGMAVTRSLMEMVVLGALMYGLVYGSIWTFKNYIVTPENMASLIPSILAGVKTPTVGPGGDLEVSGTVSTAGLFMREGPGKEYREVRAYAEGTVMKVVGKEPGQGWVKVVAPDGRSGWMSVRFLRLSVGVERVPVVEVPPVPTPTKGG